MYNNEHGSPAFDQFLQLLGRKIDLHGFDDFRGGLDVKSESSAGRFALNLTTINLSRLKNGMR
ncbi:MAG: hypothetical protein AAFO91_19085 [Bacteroidota bacterium]